MAKRANGDGTKITRSGNRWCQRVSIDGKRKAFYGATQREVREKRDVWLADYRAGRISTDAAQLTGKYLQDWLKTHRNIKESTRFDYARQIALAAPYIGSVRLDALKPAHVQKVYDELEGRGLGPVSVMKVHRVLRVAFRRAVKLGYIGRTPTEMATPPREEKVERMTLDATQMRALFEATKDHRLHALWIVFLMQGLRAGEALGLRWDDVDLDAGRLSVRHTTQRLPGLGQVTGTPKTPQSRRTLDLVPLTVVALREHRTRQLEEHVAARAWEARPEWQGLVFATKSGAPLDRGDVRSALHRALDGAGLPHLRVHDLRHSYATLLCELGCDLIHVQHALGHSTYTLTADTYTHARKGQRSPATVHLERVFSTTEAAG